MTFKTNHTAHFWDERGEYHGKTSFNKNDKIIKYGGGAYNVDIKRASRYLSDVFPLVWDRYNYTYNIGNPNPVILDKKGEPLMDPKLYQVELELRLAKQLSDLSDGGLMKFLTLKNIAIFVIGGVIVYYFATGNKII